MLDALFSVNSNSSESFYLFLVWKGKNALTDDNIFADILRKTSRKKRRKTLTKSKTYVDA